MSKIYVDEIAPKTAGNKVLMPQGGIIQHQYTMFTGTNTITITTETDVVITDLTVDITPQSTDSVIKLEGQLNGEWSNYGASYNSAAFFFRDSTKLGHPNAGNRTAGVGSFFTSYHTSDAASTPEGTAVFMYYDQPNTTNTITYKVGIRTGAGANPVYHLNKTVTDTDDSAYERYISLISATEIAG